MLAGATLGFFGAIIIVALSVGVAEWLDDRRDARYERERKKQS